MEKPLNLFNEVVTWNFFYEDVITQLGKFISCVMLFSTRQCTNVRACITTES